MTKLLQAARSGDLAQVENSIAKGADLNQVSDYDWTALMFAAWKGHEEVVVRLLDAGADPNRISKRIAKNTQGPIPKTTALAQATKNKHFSIARTLMARGAKIDPMSIALAAELEDISLLKEMVAKGADVKRGANVMHLSQPLNNACKKGRLKNVRWLVEQGAKPKSGALDMAAIYYHLDIAAYLLDLDKEQELFTEENKSHALFWTAIKQDHSPTYSSQLQMIALLLDHGANPHYRAEHSFPKNLTAAEKVRRIRDTNAGQKHDSRGEFYQEQGQKAYAHRNAIIELLEKAEKETNPLPGI